MTKEMLPYLFIGFFSVFVSSVSQTILKKASLTEHKSFLREYLNLPVILALCRFLQISGMSSKQRCCLRRNPAGRWRRMGIWESFTLAVKNIVSSKTRTLLTMLAYKKLPLSMSPAFESSSYIFVTVFGVTIFKEKVGPRKLFALFLILLGIIIFTL